MNVNDTTATNWFCYKQYFFLFKKNSLCEKSDEIQEKSVFFIDIWVRNKKKFTANCFNKALFIHWLCSNKWR